MSTCVGTAPELDRPHVLLGTGGRDPRLAVWDEGAAIPVSWLDLAPGQSVYSIDVSTDGRRVAVGTKGGRVYRLPWQERGPSHGVSPCTAQEPLFRAALPVLSVSLLADSGAAVCDALGGCHLLPRPGSGGRQQFLPSGNIICSTVSIPGGALAGLSSLGGLLIWDSDSCRLVKSLRGPVPPKHWALTRLLYWPMAEALVYPCQDGLMAMHRLGTTDVEIRQAHQGEWYALAATGDRFVTAGRSDGRFRFWEVGSMFPVRDLACPAGIVSVALLDGDEGKAVVVDDSGTAAVLGLGGGQAQSLERLPGTQYRVVVGPDLAAAAQRRSERKAARARSVAERITSASRAKQWESTEPLHRELESLGYSRLSLGLRAEQAELKGDLPEELRCRASLAGTFGEATAGATRFLERYARLLDYAWLLQEAALAYKSLCVDGARHRYQKRLTELDTVLAAMEAGCLLARPDLPLETVAACADAVGRPFLGRWLLKSGDALACRGVRLSPEAVAAKLREPTGHDGGGIAAARLESLVVVSRNGMERGQFVVFEGKPFEAGALLEFALELSDDGTQTVVFPVTMFAVLSGALCRDVTEHNRLVQTSLVGMRTSKTARTWVNELRKTALAAVGRVVNQELGRRCREMEGNNA